MSRGSVEVVPVRGGTFDVLCFRTDCWEHGEYGAAPSPFVDDADELAAANLAARQHRQQIADQDRHVDGRCSNCGMTLGGNR